MRSPVGPAPGRLIESELPTAVRRAVERALSCDRAVTISEARSVGGGCINHGCRLTTSSRERYFLKWNAALPAAHFAAEAEALDALSSTGALRLPAPIAWADTETDGPAWLLLELIDEGAAAPDAGERLAEGLHALHDSSTPPTFGWHRDNWIGSLAQSNHQSDDWGAFWATERLAPQLAEARRRGQRLGVALDRVVELTPSALADVAEPALLHGDLWGGNVIHDREGQPVLIDPSTYRGHGEVDLAMTELFGGFGATFHARYRAAAGVGPGYDAFRRDLYQLYYLLVHVSLFGGSYVAASEKAADRVLAALS